jgi:hypothetical protein
LALGAWRPLDPAEVEALWAATGGRHLVRARKIAALTAYAARLRAERRPELRLEEWLATALG